MQNFQLKSKTEIRAIENWFWFFYWYLLLLLINWFWYIAIFFVLFFGTLKGPDPECDKKCANKGWCKLDKMCQCKEGYMGQFCETALCFPSCKCVKTIIQHFHCAHTSPISMAIGCFYLLCRYERRQLYSASSVLMPARISRTTLRRRYVMEGLFSILGSYAIQQQ